MSQESPIVSQYYSWTGGHKHCYIIIQTVNMFEYIFSLYKSKMIEVEKWLLWKTTAESMITIPRFKKVWDKTKDSRSHEFAKFAKFAWDMLGSHILHSENKAYIKITQISRS